MAQPIVIRSPLSIAAKGDRFTSLPIQIDKKTAEIVVLIDRPTTTNPIPWDALSKIRVSIVVDADGVEYRCEGGTSGGVRVHRTGVELAQYRLRYVLPWGFFGARSGMPQRLGQGKSSLSARVEIELIDGSSIDSQIEVTSEIAEAPAHAFRNSVAFDAATDGQELSGDGVLSLSHTATGSDRGAFVGLGNSSGGGGQTATSVTYGGVSMTEKWDLVSSVLRNAGYTLAGPATGSQTVTATLAGATDEFGMGVVTMTGVDQTTPIGTAQTASGSSGTASVTVTGAGNDDMIVDNLWKLQSGANTPGANQTQRYAESVDIWEDLAGSTQVGVDGGVMSWTFSSNDWTIGAINFIAAATGPATLSSPTPSGTIGTQTTATVGATTNQATGTLYAVVDSAANLSGVTATQIKAGQKASGAAALASGNSAISTTTPSVGVTGLSAATLYSYAIVQNNSNGDSNVETGTFTTADLSLAITDVDGDDVITSTQTNVVINGAAFDSATVEIRQGSLPVTVEQSIDSQDSDSIQIDVVFEDAGPEDLKYGAASLFVINADLEETSIAIDIDPPTGVSFVDLTSVNTTADNRITAVPDLEAGDQLEISNVEGGSIADVSVNDDATFDVDESVSAFDVRCWSAIDKIWGAVGTQTIEGAEVTIEGDLIVSEDQDVAAIAGEVDVSGDLAATEAQDTAAISGEVEVQGDLDATEAQDVTAISGEVAEFPEIEGDLDATEQEDVAAIDGSVLVQGDLLVTDEQDVAAIAGEVEVQGDLIATDPQDSCSMSGASLVQGDLIVTEAEDVSAIDGSVLVQGDLAAVETQDVAAIAGEVEVSGDLVATEAEDVAAMAGEVDVTGDLIVTEDQDVAALNGDVIVAGDLAATEVQDTAAIEGEVEVQGDLAATEDQDVAALNGTNDVIGTMAATEAQDVAAIDGQVIVSGDLSATDPSDTATLAGEVDVTGDLSVTESTDTTSISGTVEQPAEPIEGTLAVSDSQDIPTITGTVEQARIGTLAAIEARDIAAVVGDVAELLGELIPRANLQYSTREASRFGVFTGRFENIERVRIGTKNGIAPVDFVENVETSEPKSIVPGEGMPIDETIEP